MKNKYPERKCKPIEDRFWSKVSVGQKCECWPFNGCKNWKGYGIVFLSKRGGRTKEGAHRLALKLSGIEVPDGALVLHSCDNPACCNPEHLRVGTAAENTADMYARKRAKVGVMALGHQHHNAKLTAEQVAYIRTSVETNEEIAKKYGVTALTVGTARRGDRYRNVGVAPLVKAYVIEGQRYLTVGEAEAATGYNRAKISRMCNGRSDGGYVYPPALGCGVLYVPDPNWISMQREYGRAA